MSRAHFNAGLLAALVFVAGCESLSERDVTSVNHLGSGTVACAYGELNQPAHRQSIWRCYDLKRGCNITITYRGTEHCRARLEYEGERSLWGLPFPAQTNYGPWAFTNSLGAGDFPMVTNQPNWGVPQRPTTRSTETNDVTVTLQNVTEVWLLCGDFTNPHEGGCSYTIDEIDCSRGSQQAYPSQANTASLFSVSLPCGSDERVVWTAPGRTNAPGLCTVTVVLRGSRDCFATLTGADHFGNPKATMTAWSSPQRVTIHDINRLSLKCSGTGGASDGCTLDIIQTACAR